MTKQSGVGPFALPWAFCSEMPSSLPGGLAAGRPARGLGAAVLSVLLLGVLPVSAQVDPSPEGLTKVGDIDIWGSVSPSGKLLAHVDWGTGNLALRDLDTGETRPLTAKGTWAESDEFGMFPVFSPEASRLAYTWFNDRGFWEIRSLDLTGGDPIVLFSDPDQPYVQPHSWSPDGAWILATISENAETNSLVLVASERDTAPKGLVTLDRRVPSTACFVTAGRAVVFDQLPSDGATTHALHLLPIDGGERVELAPGSDDHVLLGCSPDGERIVFASDRGDSWQIWGARLDDTSIVTDPEPLVADPGPLVRGLGVTRGGALYFGRSAGETGAYILTLNGESPEDLSLERVAEDLIHNSEATWSPNGSRLAYVTHRGTVRTGRAYSRVLEIRQMTTGEVGGGPLEMTTFGGHTFALEWMADGKFVLAQGRGRGGEGYYRIETETVRVSPVVVSENCPPACLEWPSLSTTDTLYFTRWVEGGQRLVARELATGVERDLLAVEVPAAIGPLRVSPDGRRLAIVWKDQQRWTMRLKILEAAGGEPRDLIDVAADGWLSSLDWLPDSQSLLYTTTDREGVSILWRVDVDEGDPKRLGTLEGRMRVYGLDVHPDGTRAAVTGGSPRRSEVWTIQWSGTIRGAREPE